MSEKNRMKLRYCKSCAQGIVSTAAEIKRHQENDCSHFVKDVPLNSRRIDHATLVAAKEAIAEANNE